MSQIPLTKFKVLQERISELEAEACRMREALQVPIGWRFNVLVDKHSTGAPLPGEISMLDISRQQVWGHPGQWRYSDGPNKPDVDWICEAEPLYFAPAALASTAPCPHAAEVERLRKLCGLAAPYVAGERFRWQMGSSCAADHLATRLRTAAKGGGE